MDFLRYLFNPIMRLWQLMMGYEVGPVILDSSTPTYQCVEGTCIYAFVSLSAANTINTATDMDGNNVLVNDVPPQGYEVKCRLTYLEFDSITGSVIVYVKNLKDVA